MRGIFLDTGVWVASMDRKDPLHARAREIIEANVALPFIANDLVLVETVTLLRRSLGPVPAADFGRKFLAGEIADLVRCEWDDLREGLGLIETYREHKVSLPDAASVVTIKRLDIRKVASFDIHFRAMLSDRDVVGRA